MEIISHRGYWQKSDEKNTTVAFKRALEHGFGIETDLRAHGGELVISHDIVNDITLSFENFLRLYCYYDSKSLLAINIKSDGLQNALLTSLNNFNIENYFVFDMSVPDTLGYFSNNIVTYCRTSEYEALNEKLLKKADGVWVDIFHTEWPTYDEIQSLLNQNKKITLVSPELHGRNNYKKYWNRFIKLKDNSNFSLCTDFPLEAKEFFEVK